MAENNVVLNEDDEKCIQAKSALRRYYKWRFGAIPPAGWQADHQVEQNAWFADYFGTDYVHNIANLIFVPADVNASKNHRYMRSWKSVPKKYRGYRPQWLRIDEETAFDSKGADRVKDAMVREGLYQIIQSMGAPEAFSFLTAFSRDLLMDIIRFKQNGIWKASPPQWLLDEPVWLDRLKDEVWFHTRYVSEYYAKFPPKVKACSGLEVGVLSTETLLAQFGIQGVPEGYTIEHVKF